MWVGGVNPPPGEPSQEPTVHRTHGQVPRFGPFPELRVLSEEPGELGARKVGVQDKTGPGPHLLFQPFGSELRTDGGRPPVLPNHGPVNGSQRLTVPEDHRLSLVGDPYASTWASDPGPPPAPPGTPAGSLPRFLRHHVPPNPVGGSIG